jgi:hypothetical protein
MEDGRILLNTLLGQRGSITGRPYVMTQDELLWPSGRVVMTVNWLAERVLQP